MCINERVVAYDHRGPQDSPKFDTIFAGVFDVDSWDGTCLVDSSSSVPIKRVKLEPSDDLADPPAKRLRLFAP